MARSEFVDSLHEVFERLGRIVPRRMFGGHGIFHEGRMIALVIREQLYLKADAGSAPLFDALDLQPFIYERHGKPIPLSYRQAPADLFEDRHEAALWGRRAYEAALRSGQPPKSKAPAKAAANPKPTAKAAASKKPAAKKAAARKAPVKKKPATPRKAASR